jgi:hypothetical protein
MQLGKWRLGGMMVGVEMKEVKWMEVLQPAAD